MGGGGGGGGGILAGDIVLIPSYSTTAYADCLFTKSCF